MYIPWWVLLIAGVVIAELVLLTQQIGHGVTELEQRIRKVERRLEKLESEDDDRLDGPN